MAWKRNPRAKRFLDETGTDPDDLNGIINELILSGEKVDVDELKEFADANDLESFVSELDQILRLNDDETSGSNHIPKVPTSRTTNENNISKSSSERPKRQTEARTTDRVGALFSSSDSQIRELKNNFNEIVAVSYLTLALVTIWKLDLNGLDLFQSMTLGLGLALVVPIIASEFSSKDEDFEIWKLTSTIAWLAILLSSLIGVKFAATDSTITDIFFSEKYSEMLYLCLMFVISASVWLIYTKDFDKVKGLRKVSSPIISTLLLILISFSIIEPSLLFGVESKSMISEFILMMAIFWTITCIAFGNQNIFVYGAMFIIILIHLLNGNSTAFGNSILPVAAWGLTVASWDHDKLKVKPIILILALILHGISGVIILGVGPKLVLWLVLWLIFVIFLEFTNRIESKVDYEVIKILSPQKLRGKKTLNLDKTIAIVGASESGKSCYLGALWTALNNNVVQELWYNSGDRYLSPGDDRSLPFPIDNIKRLISETSGENDSPFDDEIDYLKNYLSHRSAKFSMKEERSKGVFPSSGEGFPFTLTAKPETRRFLDNYMDRLANKDSEKRQLLVATIGVDRNSDMKDLQFSLEFVAEIRATKSIIFGLIQHSKNSIRKVITTFRTMDLPGEDVTTTLDRISGKDFTSRSVDELLKGIRSREQLFGAAVEYNLELLSVADDVLYIVDSDSFTEGGGNTPREVSSYLRLADSISRLEGSKINHISILLNKADLLLNRGDKKKRLMKGGGLKSWDLMLDRKHSLSTIEEVLGRGLIQDLDLNLDAYYSCTLGGLIEHNGKQIPTYPMIPINVIEPLIRCLLSNDYQVESGSEPSSNGGNSNVHLEDN
jgi:hypothetical protein